MASRSVRNNNPGNLRFSSFTERRGAKNDGDGYAVFKTSALGFKAMVELLQASSYRDLTIRQALNRYAPPADNNPTNEYVDYVVKQIGVNPDFNLLNNLHPSTLVAMCWAMAMFEGWKP